MNKKEKYSVGDKITIIKKLGYNDAPKGTKLKIKSMCRHGIEVIETNYQRFYTYSQIKK